MSLVVHINQKKEAGKIIDLKSFKQLLFENELAFGKPNEAFALEPYTEDEELHETLLIIYQKNPLGCGFSFFLDKDENIELRLNYPCSSEDIRIFYIFINKVCILLNIDEFIEADESYNLDQIDVLRENAIQFNQNIIKCNLEENLTIFGAIYPISVEKKLVKIIKKQEGVIAEKIFQTYLDEKQQGDYYFAKPLIYQEDMVNEIYATYTLIIDVPTIFPIKHYLPITYHLSKEIKINAWLINIISYKNNDYKVIGVIPFEELKQIIKIKECKKFDANHIIVNLRVSDMAKINKVIKKFDI